MEELLSQPATFGQSSVVLRGAELIAAEAEALVRRDASLRPTAPEPGTPAGAGPWRICARPCAAAPAP